MTNQTSWDKRRNENYEALVVLKGEAHANLPLDLRTYIRSWYGKLILQITAVRRLSSMAHLTWVFTPCSTKQPNTLKFVWTQAVWFDVNLNVALHTQLQFLIVRIAACSTHWRWIKGGDKEEKQRQGRTEQQKQQVSTNGQWHSTVARLSTGVWTAKIFTWRTEREAHSLQISWSRDRGRVGPLFYLFTYWVNSMQFKRIAAHE